MKICFKNAYGHSDILAIKPDGADVVSVNFYNTICLRRYFDLPKSLRAAAELSLCRNTDVLLHAKLDIEGDKYLSTIFFHDGGIAGVSDSITNDMYTVGNALRMYRAGNVKAGIAVDKDIAYAGAGNFFYGGAKLVFHNALCEFDKGYYAAYRSHLRLGGGIIVGLFSNGPIVADGEVKTVDSYLTIDVEKENLRVMKSFLRLSDGE